MSIAIDDSPLKIALPPFMIEVRMKDTGLVDYQAKALQLVNFETQVSRLRSQAIQAASCCHCRWARQPLWWPH